MTNIDTHKQSNTPGENIITSLSRVINIAQQKVNVWSFLRCRLLTRIIIRYSHWSNVMLRKKWQMARESHKIFAWASNPLHTLYHISMCYSNCHPQEFRRMFIFTRFCRTFGDIFQTVWIESFNIIVRRAGLLWSQQDFEWRWSVPLFKCLTVLEFSFILFDLCLLITFFNFIMNYVPIVTFWIFTYHKIWILSIMFCFIWSYWTIYFLACLEVSWRVVSLLVSVCCCLG